MYDVIIIGKSCGYTGRHVYCTSKMKTLILGRIVFY